MKQSGLAIASLVLSITGILTSCCGVGVVFSIISLIFSIIVLSSKNVKKGMSIAALIISIIGIGMSVLGISFWFSDDDSDSSSSMPKNTSKSTEYTTTTEATTEEIIPFNEIVIYEERDVIIKMTDFKDNIAYFYVENNSSLNLEFDMHSYSVNGIMANNNIYDMGCEVPSNSKSNCELEIDSEFLSDNGIDSVNNFTFHIWAYDTDASFKEFDCGIITVNVNDVENDLKTGEVLLEENGIIYELLDKNGKECTISIKNTTDTLYEFDIQNMSIDTWAYDTSYEFDWRGLQVHPNCQNIITIKIGDEFFDGKDFTEIKNMEFDFEITPNNDYFNSFSSGKIVIK